MTVPLNIRSVDYLCIINGISKNNAINILQNANLIKERGELKKLKKIITTYKMGNGMIKFGDVEVEKNKFHQHKNSISIYDVDIDKIVVPKKVSFGKKSFYFIDYKDARKVRPLRVMLMKKRL